MENRRCFPSSLLPPFSPQPTHKDQSLPLNIHTHKHTHQTALHSLSFSYFPFPPYFLHPPFSFLTSSKPLLLISLSSQVSAVIFIHLFSSLLLQTCSISHLSSASFIIFSYTLLTLLPPFILFIRDS